MDEHFTGLSTYSFTCHLPIDRVDRAFKTTLDTLPSLCHYHSHVHNAGAAYSRNDDPQQHRIPAMSQFLKLTMHRMIVSLRHADLSLRHDDLPG